MDWLDFGQIWKWAHFIGVALAFIAAWMQIIFAIGNAIRLPQTAAAQALIAIAIFVALAT